MIWIRDCLEGLGLAVVLGLVLWFGHQAVGTTVHDGGRWFPFHVEWGGVQSLQGSLLNQEPAGASGFVQVTSDGEYSLQGRPQRFSVFSKRPGAMRMTRDFWGSVWRAMVLISGVAARPWLGRVWRTVWRNWTGSTVFLRS